MLVLDFLPDVTVEKPSGVHYPVVGTDLVLTCTTSDFTATTWAWYKDGSATGETTEAITIPGEVSNNGDYHCTAGDANGMSAATPVQQISFKSKSFLIHNLKEKNRDL